VLWHQDNGYTFVEPQAYLTCWIAITDATTENGCVVVMPGAHREGTLHHRETPIGYECWGDHDRAVEVPVRAGSIVVFTSLTPHYTERNRTGDVRKAYIVQYLPDGAVAYRPQPDGSRGPAEPQDDERRQFVVVRDGECLSL
jgi:ectoine hydroxylase-related dioxygenase (phytanoyl-CoA dioxygenase family)